MKSWKERQERVTTAKFDWTEEQTDIKGSLSVMYKLLDPKFSDIIPPKDTTYSNRCSVSFTNNKLRYAYSAMDWSFTKKTYEPSSHLSVFDGTTCALLHGPDSDRKWHQGQIRNETYHIEYSNIHLQPILMMYRALTPRMRLYDIAKFDFTGQTAQIGPSVCSELYQRSNRDIEIRLWVDPARGYGIIRSQTSRKGIIQYQQDISYRIGVEGIWVPDQWTLVANNADGSLHKHYRARVTQYELNGAIPNDDFEIRFPAGTRVIDEKNQLDWIVRPDQMGKRIVSPSERTLPYAQLTSSDPGSGLFGDSGGFAKWLAIGGTLLGLAGISVVLLRRRRMHRSKP